MRCHSVITFFVVFFIIPWTYCYNILVIFPIPARSHFYSSGRLLKALAQKGHKMTVISYFPLKETISNYRDIEIGDLEGFSDIPGECFVNLEKIDSTGRLKKYFMPLVLGKVGQLVCKIGFSSKSVQSFLKEKNNFDMAIVEYFNSDCFLAVTKKFNIPVVRIHSCTLMPWTSSRYANPNHPAYMPNNFMPFSDKMTFFQRFENFLLNVFHSTYYNNFVIVNRDKSVSVKYFGETSAFIPSDVLSDSLLLVASHYTLSFPRPLVPNIIEVGGLHIEKSKTPPKVSQSRI